MTSKSADTVFLHGDLHLSITEARLNMFLTALNSSSQSLVLAPLISIRDYVAPPVRITVRIADVDVAHTGVVSGWANLVWNERCKIPLAYLTDKVKFQVVDTSKYRFNHLIGTACVSAQRIATGELIDEWVPVVSPFYMRITCPSAILVRMKFTPCSENPIYSRGVEGLKESYYSSKSGGEVTLYQDANVPDGMLPVIELDDNSYREHGKCWEDIFRSISEAKQKVYIAGWSINYHINLVMEPTTDLPGGGDMNLGDLLKHKAESGVEVVILLWNDWSGKMQTHCSETQKFFMNSSVSCLLVPRKSRSMVDFQEMVLYTHHQKCVIVDTPGNDNDRKITAFIGGLDICTGRYDTPEHRLFPDPNYALQDHSHNPNFKEGVKCPRQPWHDLHCRIEGPAAYDVLQNFEHRWKRTVKELSNSNWFGKRRLVRRARVETYDALIKIEDVQIVNPSSWVYQEDDPANWNVQIFRSIDSHSVDNFPKDAHEVNKQNLVFGKASKIIDRSIEMAYIQAIRSANHYIYIETQYFIGSSFAWPSKKNAGANNLIPIELVQKIGSKIRAKERFAVYVLIPMWPEGIPSSSIVQEILYWQCQTMQMMYETIAQELKSAGMEDAHPTDYLNFYCLGKRERPPEDTTANDQHSSNTSKRWLLSFTNDDRGVSQRSPYLESASQQNGRFMIYVHSKGMIVDDEYVILGSANINQRSMSGSRDTEIALGAYQPHYTWAKKMNHPRGQVYGYRMSLWAEHLGLRAIDDCFKDPEKLDCVKEVNRVAVENWKRYTAEQFTLLQGHILKYPVHIEDDGKINSLPGHETFPDVGGMILGACSTLPKRFPRRLTT